MTQTYIVQMDGAGALVKIGRSRSVKSRISQLQTGLPWAIRLVALIGSDVEAELLAKFSDNRIRGEWFSPSQSLADWLTDAAEKGRLVKQRPVDQGYLNAVIKPRIIEYLAGREPLNNAGGDLVRCIFADLLPSLVGREKELVIATKGHVTDALCRGYGPTNELPHLTIPAREAPAQDAAA